MSRPVRGERVLPEVEDTEALGRELAAELTAGDLVILDGPLGAGKTALTRGIAAGLGVTGRVSSPTFIIAREHRPGASGGPGLVHVDAYRLGGLDELDALDLDTDLEDCVVVVEWGEGVAERLADRHLMVRLRRAEGTDVRTVTWEWVDGA
ncbi:tRNA (adenosine(37)-N6)-threonylcarbamoyltransferase complex ATPase subunit type 1 TsaE [Tsukamurella hominis]|uniref:tRNA (adenosine(37)-N6)-threonylcarbamoyltransferase complex ATPase subunit type 1 TsaE n=1 Tax=Tsukamurella hominis TaxID=1970232 RepID=UPI0039EC7B47